MIIQSGKHEGKHSEDVFLKEPDYVVWYVQNYPQAALGKAFISCTKKFNSKPFTIKCISCAQRATRATGYANSPNLYFWCDDCDTRGMGAQGHKLREINTYQGAITHIDMTANGKKHYKKDIIKQLSQAKGLSKRVTSQGRAEFFA